MSTNIVILSGNLGNDVNVKTFQDGSKVGNFSLATNRVYKDKEGVEHKQVHWHSIVVSGKLADNCSKFLHKGSKVLVNGRLSNRSYEKDGITYYVTEVVASRVEFLDPKSSTEEE